MPFTMKRSNLFIIITLLILGFYAAWLYIQNVALGCLVECSATYRAVIDGTALSPYRYRVLSSALVYVVGNNPQTDIAIATAYSLAHGIVFPLTFLTYYKVLRRWVSALSALLGVVLLVMYLPVMMRIYGTSLYLPIELALFSLALSWMRPGWRFALLVILATLNRETGILLVLAFAAVHLPQWRDRRIQSWTIFYAILWGVVFVGLRLWRGPAVDEVTTMAAWDGNTNSWRGIFLLTNHVFFIPLYISVFASWRYLSGEMKRLLIIVGIPYFLLFAIFGFLNEVRLLMPLMPFLTVALVATIERTYLGSRQSLLD